MSAQTLTSTSESSPIVIVGSTGSIGSAISRRLASQNQPIHLVGRNPETLKTLSAAGIDAPFSVCDLT